jgi:uncharacterized Fe-S cluster protein YjdI
MEHEFRGQSVTITYDDDVCTHAANCVRSLPGVFDANRRPWVDPDGASADEIAAAVRACPSGALSLRRDD